MLRSDGSGDHAARVSAASSGGIVAESMRVITTREGAFRVSAPNSRPRDILVVAIDAGAAALLTQTAGEGWRGTTFRRAFSSPGDEARSGQAPAWCDLGRAPVADMAGEIARADLVVMVATGGAGQATAARIGDACLRRGVKTAGVIVQDVADLEASGPSTLRELRRSAQTVSVCSEAAFVPAMLRGLGA